MPHALAVAALVVLAVALYAWVACAIGRFLGAHEDRGDG